MTDDMTPEQRREHGMEPAPHEATDRDGAIRHFVDREMTFPAELRARYIASIDQQITRLTQDGQPGDELWVCRSRYVGPLAGHEGLGIVRDGKVVRYEKIVNY